ncbi:MAG: GNAT family N-acetyltransferase [Desulfobacteraceae bacterium]|jgi:ribosomal protein S18 acetylase RimI-like enzyme
MIFHIIQANPKDAEEILNLQKLAYRSEALLYNDWTIPPLTQSLSEIETEFESMFFFKALNKTKIIGSVRTSYDGITCRIGRLIVHPKFQKKGIGTSLMKKIESAFSHAKRFKLFTGSKSIENIGLYQRLGYQIVREESLSLSVRLVFMEKQQQKIKPDCQG